MDIKRKAAILSEVLQFIMLKEFGEVYDFSIIITDGTDVARVGNSDIHQFIKAIHKKKEQKEKH